MIQVTTTPIDASEVIKSVATICSGAVVHFIGMVREEEGIQGLDYECYPPMAERVIGEIVQAAFAKWPLQKVSVVHRYGWIPLGEAAVMVAVSSPHRKEAFEACQFVMDTIKQDVPLWKKGGHCSC